MLKVGDRVRSISDDGTGGKEGILIQDDHSVVPYLVRFDDWRGGHGDGGNEWWLNHDELVPVAEATETDADPKFKVGDRVKFRDDYNSSARGTEATVVSVDSCGIMVDGVHGKSTEQPSSLQHVPTTLTPQPGKFYRTRDGRKVGPMVQWSEGAEHPWESSDIEDQCLWREDGTTDYEVDLIAEWVDEPQPANDNSTAGFTIPLEEEMTKKHDPSLAEVEHAEAMVRTGVYTVNEVRTYLGLPTIPGGHKLAA